MRDTTSDGCPGGVRPKIATSRCRGAPEQSDRALAASRFARVGRLQHRMIRQLEGQSLLWESVAETRAELIRNLRAALGLDPDVNDEEEQLRLATIYTPRQAPTARF